MLQYQHYDCAGPIFENKNFKNLLNTYNIKMYHTQNLEKSAINERFHRTLNSKLKVQQKVDRYLARFVERIQL